MAIKYQSAIKAIQDAGFTHIKVELEGHLRRGSRGVVDGYHLGDDDDCERFLKDQLSAETKRKINYMRFYNDGSVDSEVTFTLPVQHSEIIVEVIQAWNQLVEANGGTCDVNGAGMHIAVLPTATYPSPGQLPADKVRNFKSEVTKLLPALYIAATSGDFTRGLRFRQAAVSSGTKYSAIYLRNDASIEYRLFETCYQRPEAVFEFIGVIARTLEYYTDPTKKVESTGEVFSIYEGEGLKGYTSFSTQIKILKRQFKYVQPEGMTVREFMECRNINLTLKSTREKEAGRIAKLKLSYQERKKAHEKVRSEPLNQFHLDNIEYWKSVEPNHPEDFYWERVTGHKAKIETERAYIDNNLVTSSAIATVRT